MHTGYNDSKVTYEINGKDLDEINEMVDLAVNVQFNSKYDERC
jgi:hypothetical protein